MLRVEKMHRTKAMRASEKGAMETGQKGFQTLHAWMQTCQGQNPKGRAASLNLALDRKQQSKGSFRPMLDEVGWLLSSTARCDENQAWTMN